MESLVASGGISVVNHSTDQQRLVLGNVVDEGGGDEKISSHNHWRSPMRVCYFSLYFNMSKRRKTPYLGNTPFNTMF